MNLLRQDEILHSIWKWKLLSTAAIAEEFFANQYSDAAYKCLLRFRANGLIQRLCLPDTRDFLWTLTAKGFGKLRRVLPALLADGFRSEAVTHDYLCSALQRGHWLTFIPHGITLVSEQQLRRCHSEHLDKWIPRSDLHRADGFTVIETENAVEVTALEVELNKKAPTEYAKISSFYSAETVTRVLWLVPRFSMARWIADQIKSLHSDRLRIHQFILLPDFLDTFWKCRIVLGAEAGRHIHEIFGQPASQSCLSGERPAMLDLRARPYSSVLYPRGADRQFLNRVAFQAHSTPKGSPVPSAIPNPKGDHES